MAQNGSKHPNCLDSFAANRSSTTRLLRQSECSTVSKPNGGATGPQICRKAGLRPPGLSVEATRDRDSASIFRCRPGPAPALDRCPRCCGPQRHGSGGRSRLRAEGRPPGRRPTRRAQAAARAPRRSRATRQTTRRPCRRAMRDAGADRRASSRRWLRARDRSERVAQRQHHVVDLRAPLARELEVMLFPADGAVQAVREVDVQCDAVA